MTGVQTCALPISPAASLKGAVLVCPTCPRDLRAVGSGGTRPPGCRWVGRGVTGAPTARRHPETALGRLLARGALERRACGERALVSVIATSFRLVGPWSPGPRGRPIVPPAD